MCVCVETIGNEYTTINYYTCGIQTSVAVGLLVEKGKAQADRQ